MRRAMPVLVAFLTILALVPTPAGAEHTPDPVSVAVVGDLQDELGCSGDWQPDCADTELGFDAGDDVWQGVFSLPAGSWEYKSALNDSWDENYGANATQNGANIPLVLGAGTDVKFYYDHKSHWITDSASSVIASVPGSFQSELGCSDDWDPGCLRSWLQDPDGDGTYSFTTGAIPAGDYEAKVAVDESWDENYGAGGVANGPNIPFSVPEGATVTFSWDSISKVPTVAVGTGGGSGLEPGDEALVRPPVRHPFEDQILYFTMPDRFDDGDPTNNCGDYPGPCVANDTQENVLTHGYLPADRGYYHGGDIQGLHDRLDYLQAMGVTAIWVGPIYKNKSVQPDSSNLYGHSSGYHGYWIEDFLQVDPHLGTNEEFKALVDDAHSRGIQVFMDVVTNHTADVVQLEGNAGYRDKTNFPYLDVDNVPFDDSDYAYHGQDPYEFPEVDLTSFPYTPTVPAGEEAVKNPAWLNDPLLYHNRGDSSFSGENSLYGDFFGLDDLWTERREVVDGMIDIYSFWIEEFGVDGFRIDTTKHVNMEFWQKFGPDILAAADAAGIGHFFAFGEVFDQNFGPVFLSEFSTRGKLQSTIDFTFQLLARNYAGQDGSAVTLRDVLALDDLYIDADSNAYVMPTFVGNHDMGRIGYFLQRVDQVGAADDELVARSKLAQAMMFFFRGQPVIYYGDEQGFTGDGGDKLARQDMFANVVPEYADDDLLGTDATTSEDNFDPTHPIYAALAEYAAAYSTHDALRSGAQIHRFAADGPGVYAFSRIERAEKVEYVVAFNNAETAIGADVPTYYGEGMAFEQVIASDTAPAMLTTNAGGALPVSVPALGFVIYRASEPIPAGEVAPGIDITTVSDGETVTLGVESMDGHDVVERLEVGAQLDRELFAEVTFAASVDGGEYVPIGTDDNPPYRVFYDVSSLPEGATVSFKAIVDDLSGNLNADKVEGVVPVVESEPPTPGTEPAYGIIHYLRDDGDYGDHATGDYNDYWGLHLWDDIDEVIDWTAPKPFLGEDEYGRFAWVKLAPGASNVGFIVHKGDTKDGTNADRFFDPTTNPEIWLRSDDATTYTSQAEAQGYVTIHYRRADGDYTGWGLHLWGDAIDPSEGTTWTTPKPPTGIDDYGAYWDILIQNAALPVEFIVHRGDTKDPGPDQSMVPVDDAAIWLQSGDETIYAERGAAQGFVTIHYHRPAGDYGDYTSTDYNDFWGLHTWSAADDTGWTTPRKPTGQDMFGIYWEVPITNPGADLGYIIHRGDGKDPGPDQFLAFDETGYEVWQLQGADPDDPYILPIRAAGPHGDISEQHAYWVSEETIVWDPAEGAAGFELVYAPEGGLALTDTGIAGGTSIPLTPAGPFDPATLGREGFDHLAGLPVYTVSDADLALVRDILKGQLTVLASGPLGRVDATGLQIQGVLDDLYAAAAYDEPLGVVWDGGVPALRLWAPTATSVTLHLFADADPATTASTLPMAVDPATGIWSAAGDGSWNGKFYLYEVEVYVRSTGQVEHNLVTDPYSVSLAMNSTRSQIVDLADPALAPDGWDELAKPELAAPEDIALYELHVRDFSVNDPTVPEELQGTFKAFTLEDTDGTNHLEALAEAGLTHLHLLPSFDIATINENKAEWEEADPATLASYPPDSDQQQAAVTAVEDLDGFNWGYDPFHYTVPEGSYSTDPDGPARIVEFREMVQALNEDGIRVVMDVVYNHTNASGQAEKSVLDRVVPGYYHRLNDRGQVETSTCCANTATEFLMMEKLMIDSVVTWARDYQIDGFRFDLMGHHSKQNMLNLQQALADAGRSDVYLYGEGWNFGEVANNARFLQATQLNMAGTGIGTFNDRLRDAVRGGGPFDGGNDLIRNQGFISGLFYDPNELNATATPGPEPGSVTIAGSLQSELGCPGDWQPECAETQLAYDADDVAWLQTFAVPAGSWEYKAALNGSWDENYGANAAPNGPNIGLNLAAGTEVKFYYSTATHWVTDDQNSVIATVPGSFQSELGCPGDWDPGCLRSWLQDPDGDGTYAFSAALPAGDYEAKVAIDESWDENYGAGGVQNGPNIPFSVSAGQTVLFSYDAATHVLGISFGSSDQLAELLLSADQIRVGLAGNLAGYQFEDRTGTVVSGSEVDYNGAPAGYTADPQEHIVYVSAHDNQTLFDIGQYKHPTGTSMDDRVRAQNLGIDFTVLSQGVPFLHAGVDMLRSKSLDRDSFNSGDWFNRLDFGYQDNNWGAGLPVASKNESDWPLMQPLLADPALKPGPDDIAATVSHTREMLEIRNSSPLFRLRTAAEVQALLRFHNTGPAQIPGLIVMSLGDLSAPYGGGGLAVVLFNANDEGQTFTISDLAGTVLELHPVQVNGSDEVVKSSTYDPATGTFTLPARTAAVFVLDVTPPVVSAGTTQLTGSNNTGNFLIGFSCSDNDPESVTIAHLNGIPVEDGQVVRLIENPGSQWARVINGILNIKAPSFTLTVTCTDRAGNSTTVTVVPEFRPITSLLE